ncbi:hypothetical protein L7F22_036397 [Adiantum nelumboides]|nr:hypothetical protein [Adiantum nelumboides]
MSLLCQSWRLHNEEGASQVSCPRASSGVVSEGGAVATPQLASLATRIGYVLEVGYRLPSGFLGVSRAFSLNIICNKGNSSCPALFLSKAPKVECVVGVVKMIQACGLLEVDRVLLGCPIGYGRAFGSGGRHVAHSASRSAFFGFESWFIIWSVIYDGFFRIGMLFPL